MIQALQDFIAAAPINIYFALLSLPIGFVFAILLALGLTGNRWSYFACNAYVYAFRGTPLFIQFYFFYALMRASGLGAYKNADGERVLAFMLDALAIGPLVLLLNTAAYSAVIFANAIRAVPRGELEAADAFGFSPWQRFTSVTWPAMIRIAWPAYTNEAVFLFLSTTLVYASLPITKRAEGRDFKDIFAVAKDTAEATFNPFVAYIPAMAIFVLMTLGLFFFAGLVNQRLNRHLPSQRRNAGLRFRPNFLR